MKALLMPILDKRNSFHEKAIVIKDNNISIKLQSYDTIVAEYFPIGNILKIYNCQSQTTRRHINEFIYQYAPFYSRKTKKEMEEMVMLNNK